MSNSRKSEHISSYAEGANLQLANEISSVCRHPKQYNEWYLVSLNFNCVVTTLWQKKHHQPSYSSAETFLPRLQNMYVQFPAEQSMIINTK